MKSKSKKIIAGIGIAFTFLVAPAVYRENFSDKIRSMEDLNRIVSEEIKKLEKDKTPGEIYLTSGKTPWGTAASAKLSEGKYLILLDREKTRVAIRHELYHIYAGHCDRAFAKGEWTTWDKVCNETTANIYTWYGLRL